MSEQCLELKNVCKSFRDFTLNNISFTLPQGYIMGLVGPNGAGKTTTIQLILNMLEKDAGRILAFGKDNVVSEKEIKQDIGIVFDSIFYVDSWTVKDTEKAVWCCTIKVDIENSKGQYIEKDKQEATKDGSESTKIQHGI